MNTIKMLTFMGVAATSVIAHRHKHDEHDEHLKALLHEKEQFIATCSEEITMCEDILAQAGASLVIVDPSDDGSNNADPVDIVRQCVEESLTVCLPALDSKDPATIGRCVFENRKEIFNNLKDMSPECQQAFRDLLPHHRGRHERDHDDAPHGRGFDDDGDDDDDYMSMHLSASGAEIGACLLSHTQNLTAPCLSTVESVNTSSDDAWAFLDAEPQEASFHWPRHWFMGLAVMTFVCCCCVRAYKRRTGGGRCGRGPCCSRASTPNGNPDAPQPRPFLPVGPSVQTAFPQSEDSELDRAIAASLAETNRTTPSAPPAPPAAVDVAYTGTNREPFLRAGAIHSDQYV